MDDHSDLKAALEAMHGGNPIPSPPTKAELLPFITVDLGDGCTSTFPPDQIESIYVTPEWARLRLKTEECFTPLAGTPGYASIARLQAAITDMYKGPTL